MPEDEQRGHVAEATRARPAGGTGDGGRRVRSRRAPSWTPVFVASLLLGGCYAHSPEVHGRASLTEAPGRWRVFDYAGRIEGGGAARARLEARRDSAGRLSALALDVRAEGRRLTLEARAEAAGWRFSRQLELAGIRRRWEGEVRADRLHLALVEGPGAPADREVPWGPSSVLDLGHPLAWAIWLDGEARSRVRAVRLTALDPGGVVIDHLDLERPGPDPSGRRRLLVRGREGATALWLDARGRPVRARFRLGGRGTPRVEWRAAGGGASRLTSGSE